MKRNGGYTKEENKTELKQDELKPASGGRGENEQAECPECASFRVSVYFDDNKQAYVLTCQNCGYHWVSFNPW